MRGSGISVDLLCLCSLSASGSSPGHGGMETDQVLPSHPPHPYGSECKLWIVPVLCLEDLPLSHFQTGTHTREPRGSRVMEPFSCLTYNPSAYAGASVLPWGCASQQEKKTQPPRALVPVRDESRRLINESRVSSGSGAMSWGH